MKQGKVNNYSHSDEKVMHSSQAINSFLENLRKTKQNLRDMLNTQEAMEKEYFDNLTSGSMARVKTRDLIKTLDGILDTREEFDNRPRALGYEAFKKRAKYTKSVYCGDEWTQGFRDGMAIVVDLLTAEIGVIEISDRFKERPVRVTYLHRLSSHIRDRSIIAESALEKADLGNKEEVNENGEAQ